MVSIGNEIRNGILWPVGQVADPAVPADYDNLATLLKAGVAGAQAGNPPGHQLLIMMHYDQGGNNQLSQAFYQNLVAQGVPFDVIGLSYYPFFHGTISQMKANVDALATQFHKKIVIAETQYPWTLANGNSPLGDSTGNFVWEPSQLSAGYPASPGGQLSFVTDELSILAQVPGRAGRRAVLLGAGLDPRRSLGAGHRHRHAQRQPHPVQLPGRGAAVDRDLPRTRPRCARATTPGTCPAWSAADFR